MNRPAAPESCPRCGEASCNDPDSKACSDNCIGRLQRQVDLAQTEIKGHMRIQDDLKAEVVMLNGIIRVRGEAIAKAQARIAVLEKAALRVVEASDRDVRKGLSQQVAVENFSDSRPEEIEYIEAHLALLEAMGQLDAVLKDRA